MCQKSQSDWTHNVAHCARRSSLFPQRRQNNVEYENVSEPLINSPRFDLPASRMTTGPHTHTHTLSSTRSRVKQDSRCVDGETCRLPVGLSSAGGVAACHTAVMTLNGHYRTRGDTVTSDPESHWRAGKGAAVTTQHQRETRGREAERQGGMRPTSLTGSSHCGDHDGGFHTLILPTHRSSPPPPPTWQSRG